MNPRAFFAQRPLVCLAACYAPGILLSVIWAGFQPALPLIGLVASLVAALLLRSAARARAVALCLAALMLGALIGGLAAHPALPEEGHYQVSGRVVGQSQWNEDGTRIRAVLHDVQLTSEDEQIIQVNRAYWTWHAKPGDLLPLDGQAANFTGRVYQPAGRVNPHGFDFRMHLLQQGIPVGISGATDLALTPADARQAASFWLQLRQAIAERLDLLFGGQAPLAKALLIGVREDLEEGTQQDFRDAGIAHVLAVSGLHVGFLVLALGTLLRLLSLSPRLQLALVSLFLLFYCALLGFTPSVVRAAILSVLLLSSRVALRRVDTLTSLSAAFLLILLIRPLDLFNLGFQLSFLAVLGIIAVGDRLNNLLLRWRWLARQPEWVMQLALAYATTLSASLAVLVPLANSFHFLSLIGLLISPPAILLIGVLMQGFALVLLLSYLALPLSQVLALPLRGWAILYQSAVTQSAAAPHAVLSLRSFGTAFTAGYYALLWLGTRYVVLSRRARLTAISALCALLLTLGLWPRDSGLRYIQLSTGFSDSAIILDGSTTYVLDAGTHGGDLANYLLAEGRAVDALILTHLHADHAGGLAQLLERGVRIHQIFLPYGAQEVGNPDGSLGLLAQAKQAGIKIRALGRGDILGTSRVKGQVLWPYHGALYPGMDANRGSLVIYWQLDGVSLLAMGDLAQDYQRYAQAEAQVLKSPHHGSRADNQPALLSAVSPTLALITAADNSPQRHAATREHLDQLGIRHLVSGQTGAITLRISGDELQVETYLQGVK